tara:strand:+ start:271 stop:420 length:150 start_codon:yes stop_codon:yes gene_type:complete
VERFLFQGDSCFPLSPINKDKLKEETQGKKVISQNDLVKVMLKYLGKQS